jgi:hypothetical protein
MATNPDYILLLVIVKPSNCILGQNHTSQSRFVYTVNLCSTTVRTLDVNLVAKPVSINLCQLMQIWCDIGFCGVFFR